MALAKTVVWLKKSSMSCKGKVTWSQQVWGRSNTPKDSFISWIAIQNRLKTRDRLLQIGLSGDDQCVSCYQHRETSCHIFSECPIAVECLKEQKTIVKEQKTQENV
ncbi:hypothetical protein F8388_005735 [Cannabis sativa]|uniref:Reverse transcriptase zinc-binding domain-containing protein n=1 Tax=Cannabis sativa TaxID=3483 RepID=A0A7J6EPI1_CANSA|nr:hypothetical protein F8388_005735 [Cannabis sativa]